MKLLQFCIGIRWHLVIQAFLIILPRIAGPFLHCPADQVSALGDICTTLQGASVLKAWFETPNIQAKQQ